MKFNKIIFSDYYPAIQSKVLMTFRFCFLVIIGIASSCNSSDSIFIQHSSDQTGIHFNNIIIENDSINPIDLEFLYNGGGVAAGDFNNDGKTDLYFTASTQSNKLYLNKGDFKFEDVTAEAQVSGNGRWASAASIIDINNDGWLDIYVCNSILKRSSERANLLYINNGNNANGVPTFTEMAMKYNLADTSYSVHAAFFDYDNDGDLDLYILTTKLNQRDAVQFMNQSNIRDTTDVDRLYRNDWDSVSRHPVFTDVSKEAGIFHNGYGLGIAIADINDDGWKDVYVTNDFYGSDVLYINNRNGTFTDKALTFFKHTSQNAMGNDIADINNDGLADIIAVDMNPEDNYRKKKNMGGNNYNIYQNMLHEGYTLQYVRNTLQLNLGYRPGNNDSIGDPIFADIAFYSGVAETDWSWNPSLADFDNDGLRDIIITNGYPRDVTDHDFGAFRSRSGNVASKEQLIDQMPQIKIPNYAFRNQGTLKFENVTEKWGFTKPSFSNGAVYADLDNDGDLDYVINNINDEAFVYENTTRDGVSGRNYIKFEFQGGANNINGIGTIVRVYYNGQQQVYENAPNRGYLSTVEPIAFFGLDTTTVLDSAICIWPGGNRQVLRDVKANQTLEINYKNAGPSTSNFRILPSSPVFIDATLASGIDYRHFEMDFIDFNEQPLLPHKLSQYGPGLAAGDIDGNALDDIVIGGTGDNPGKFLFQQMDRTFVMKDFPPFIGKDIRNPENMGVLLFDADNDGDLDLYLANGSNEFVVNTKSYQDRIGINDGAGQFTWDTLAIPLNYTSKSCVKAVDFDKDGDLDLLVGGRVIPRSYPKAVSSFILRNDSSPGKIKFTDITESVAPGLTDIGLVCDAVWTDFDNDGWTDIILVGEWMPITFFKNQQGHFVDVTKASGIASSVGWWNSIAAGDFDNDGDIDYIAGNLGTNTFYRGSEKYPVSIYAKDFDQNKGYDIVPTLYLPGPKGEKREFPAHTRDDMVGQLPGLKKRFLTYKEYASTDIANLLSENDLKDALILRANYFESSYIENLGNGKFKLTPLPVLAQLAPIYGMVVDDFDSDGNLDLALVGNDFGTEVSTGRYDALNGMLLTGNGKGSFEVPAIHRSGIFVPGDAKALVKLAGADSVLMLAASQNRGLLKVFRKNEKISHVALSQNDAFLLLSLKNGKKRKEEIYHGSSFLSQSSNRYFINGSIDKIEVVDQNGKHRILQK